MVFTIVNSIEFTFRKCKKHENGHLPHYDSFRGRGSHFLKIAYSLKRCEGPHRSTVIVAIDTVGRVFEPQNNKADELNDEDDDDDNDHLGVTKEEACLQWADDADTTLHEGQGGDEVGEEEENFSLLTYTDT